MNILRISLYISITFTLIIVNTVIIEGYYLDQFHNASMDVYYGKSGSKGILLQFFKDYLNDYKLSNGTKSYNMHMHPRNNSSLNGSALYEHIDYAKLINRLINKFEFARRKDLRRLERSLYKKGLRTRRYLEIAVNMTEEEEKEMRIFYENDPDLMRQRFTGILKPELEVEVEKIHNTTICDYTVVPVPDPTGTRIPKDLKHVMCNNAGSLCYDTGFHSCTQTYTNIDVTYGNGTTEIIKLYMGCVCSVSYYEGITYLTPKTVFNDFNNDNKPSNKSVIKV